MEAGHNPVGTELRERLGLIPLERDADSRPLTAADVRLRRPIGEIFVELGFITQGQLEGALAVQKTTGARIGEILVEQGILTRLDLASALAEHWESGQPEAPVVWPSPGNGVPVTPLPEPGLVAGDAAAIVELEPRLELAEDRVEPARPARRRWRRSVRVDDALATEARFAAVEAAIRDVAGRGMPAGDSAEQRRTDRPDALITRLELLERRLEALAVLEQRVVVLAASTVELGAELHALTDRPPGTEPRHQLSELAQRVESIEIEGRERLGMLNAAVSDLGRRLDEQAAIGEEQARASEWAIREGLASLHEGLTGAEPEFSTDGAGARSARAAGSGGRGSRCAHGRSGSGVEGGRIRGVCADRVRLPAGRAPRQGCRRSGRRSCSTSATVRSSSPVTAARRSRSTAARARTWAAPDLRGDRACAV